MIAKADKVLVVDDNEANRSLAKATLEDEGYDVVVATGGAEALALFDAERPDCVLLDVRMPDMDGFAVCERLRALPEGADVPILFLTALRDVDTFDRATAVGGDDFLTKPVRPTELVVRVKTTLELRRAKAELREHYELLKKQRDDLLRLQLQKERLTAFIVHDLKNPVNALDLHAQLLVRDKGLSESARSSAEQIRSGARRLTQMIMNLLDVSKADEGQLAPKRAVVDLPAVVARVRAELEVSAKDRGVELRVEALTPRVFADAELLPRVLTNLIENAIRYSSSGTAVTISSRVAPAPARATEVRVADSGPGIPPELKDKVFDPFVQVDSGAGARTSRGLGLSFCRATVEAHGGTIWVEDASPGAVFCFTLPDE